MRKKNRLQLEKHFLTINQQDIEKTKAQESVDKTRSHIEKMKAIHFARYQAYREELKSDGELTYRLRHAQQVFTDTLEVFKKTLKEDLKQKITDHFSCPSWDKVLHAAELMAFTMGDPKQMVAMGGIEVGILINDGMNNIPDNMGNDISKAALFDEIESLGNMPFDEMGSQIFKRGEDGKPEIEEKAKLFLADLSEFEQEVSSLSTELGVDEITEIVLAIQNFKNAIIERGEAQIIYITYQIKLVEEYNKYLEANSRLDELNEEVDPMTPQWVSTVSYFSALYQEQLDQAIEQIALLERKLAFVTLDYHSEHVASLAGLWFDAQPPSAEDVLQLGLRVDKIYDTLNEHGSSRVAAKDRLPKDDKLRSPLFVHIKQGDMLEQFKRDRKITFTIVPKSTGRKNEVVLSNGHYYYDIRVESVQPRVIGAHTRKDKLLRVSARMATSSSIYDMASAEHHFGHHLQRGAGVMHKIGTDIDSETNDDLHGTQGKLDDQYLDALGVYSRWTITVPDGGDGDANDGLNMDDVTDLIVYFQGYARSRV